MYTFSLRKRKDDAECGQKAKSEGTSLRPSTTTRAPNGALTKDGIEVANYDRGWDILPATDEAQEVVSEIIQRYN